MSDHYNSTDTLKKQAQHAPSQTAWRNLGQSGNNVSVKYRQGDVSYNDSYTWYHRTNRITEAQAQDLLNKLTEEQEANAAAAGKKLDQYD